MQNYNGNSAAITARPATVTVSNPEDAIDDVTATSNNAAIQTLADNVKWLHEKTGLLATASAWTALQTFATAKVTTAPAAADDVVRKTELDAEIAARIADVNTEETARIADVDAEETARIAGDNALDARLDVIEGAATSQALIAGDADFTVTNATRRRKNGVVTLTGWIRSLLARAAGTKIADLPDGLYNPPVEHRFTCTIKQNAGPVVVVHLRVTGSELFTDSNLTASDDIHINTCWLL